MTRTSTVKLIILAAVVTAGLSIPPAASAQTRFGVRAGIYTRDSDPFVGGEVLLPFQPRLFFDPNVEVVFASGSDLVTVNADFHYDLNAPPGRYLWVGAGPALVINDPEPDEPGKRTRAGLNLIIGGGWRTGSGLIPYLQGKVLLSNHTQGVIAVGVRF
ncbi:MAG: hypothetical protein ACM3O7_00485 [Acidobacteriota bacterium]